MIVAGIGHPCSRHVNIVQGWRMLTRTSDFLPQRRAPLSSNPLVFRRPRHCRRRRYCIRRKRGILLVVVIPPMQHLVQLLLQTGSHITNRMTKTCSSFSRALYQTVNKALRVTSFVVGGTTGRFHDDFPHEPRRHNPMLPTHHDFATGWT